MKTVKPYSKIKLSHLSEELNISEKELESLLVNLVLDDVLDAKINQVTGMVEINRESIDNNIIENEEETKGKGVDSEYDALTKWSNEIKRTNKTLFNNLC